MEEINDFNTDNLMEAGRKLLSKLHEAKGIKSAFGELKSAAAKLLNTIDRVIRPEEE